MRSCILTDESLHLETCGEMHQGRVVSGTVVESAVSPVLTVGSALVEFDILCPSKATGIAGGGTLQRGAALSADLILQVMLSGEIL